MESRWAPTSNKPQLILSDDIRTANWDLLEKGYLMIGFSKFDGTDIDEALALQQAKKIGADVVLVQKKFTKSLTETVAITQWPANETTEITEDTDYTGNRGPKKVKRRIEVTTSRGPETVLVPKQVDYYEHSTTFWKKLEKPIFGAVVIDLSDELKQKLETNRGLVIRNIVMDSPAYNGDLLKGDIILKINGQPAPGSKKFYDDMITHAGKKMKLTILRGEKTLEKSILLNP
jgi:hypothetical protein